MIIKKISLLCIVCFALLSINISLAYASIDAAYTCENKRCLEGTLIDYSVTVYNNLNHTVLINDVYLKDVNYNNTFAYDIRSGVYIGPRESYVFSFKRAVEAPVEGYTFYYKPCFTATVIYDDKTNLSDVVCDEVVRSLTVLPLSKIECYDNKECDDVQYCFNYKCRELKCSAGEQPLNHECHKRPFDLKKLLWTVLVVLVILFIYAGFMLKKKRKERKKAGKKKTRKA